MSGPGPGLWSLQDLAHMGTDTCGTWPIWALAIWGPVLYGPQPEMDPVWIWALAQYGHAPNLQSLFADDSNNLQCAGIGGIGW